MLIFKPETIQEVLVNATRALGVTLEYHEARLQAELLLGHALGIGRERVLARLNETIAPEVAAQYAANVARRAQHEPLAYILGHQEFYGLDFLVDRRVLIPRHETELIVDLALKEIRHVPHATPYVIDIGTGSGAIALTLAHHLPQAQILAVDISREALAVAQLNAERLAPHASIQWIEGDLLERVNDLFDVLVANLPYIPRTRFRDLPREVRAYEPRLALDGGDDGLDVMRRLLAQLEAHAAPGADAWLEISEEQGAAATELAHQTLPRAVVTLHRDLEGLDRVVQVQLNGRIL